MSCGVRWLGILICWMVLAMPGPLAGAENHSSNADLSHSWSNQDSVHSSGEADAVDGGMHAGHRPSSEQHANQHPCTDLGTCHVVGVGPTIGVDPYNPNRIGEADLVAAMLPSDVPPPLHPPRHLIDI